MMLAKMATRAEAARLLVVQAAQAKARGERADLEAGMAKYFATEAAQENALDCMRIHGGYGYSLEFRPERYYRDAPLLLIGEGSNEIQQLIIARRLLERVSDMTRRSRPCRGDSPWYESCAIRNESCAIRPHRPQAVSDTMTGP